MGSLQIKASYSVTPYICYVSPNGTETRLSGDSYTYTVPEGVRFGVVSSLDTSCSGDKGWNVLFNGLSVLPHGDIKFVGESGILYYCVPLKGGDTFVLNVHADERWGEMDKNFSIMFYQ